MRPDNNRKAPGKHPEPIAVFRHCKDEFFPGVEGHSAANNLFCKHPAKKHSHSQDDDTCNPKFNLLARHNL